MLAMRRRANRRGPGPVPHQARPSRTTRTTPRPRAYFPFRPYCAVLRAGRHHRHLLRRPDHRARLHLRLRRDDEPVADRAGRRQAGLEGRLADALGLRGRDVRARRRGPLLAWLQLHRRRRAGRRRSSAARCRCTSGIRSSARQRVGEDERLARRRPDPGRRAGDLRGAAAALAVRAAPAEQSITLAFDAEVGRVYDEWDALSRKVADGTAEPCRPGGLRPRLGTAEGTAAGHAAPAAVPHPGLGRRHHGRRRGADAADPAGPDRRSTRSPRWTRSGPGWTAPRPGSTEYARPEDRTHVRARARSRPAGRADR